MNDRKSNRNRWFPRPMGRVAARIHGAANALRQWDESATLRSKALGISPEFAASLRGKAAAYREAAELLDAIEDGRRLPRRWMPPRPLTIEERLEASSLGTPKAQALRATVSDEQAAQVVARADELSRAEQLENGRKLASEREDLIAQGADPSELVVPLGPAWGPYSSVTPAHDVRVERRALLIQHLDGTRWYTPDATVEITVDQATGKPHTEVTLNQPWQVVPPGEPAPCPTCSGPTRETVGMVCQTCGTDYGATS